MKVTLDTNVLVRLITDDDPVQGKLARKLAAGAELIAMPLPALVEMCWVLERAYDFPKSDVARALRALINADNAATDFPAVEAGLSLLDAGGDFADGVIAHDGQWLGGETFLSFDKKAVRILQESGHAARIPQ
ncbi:MAG TPA: type II toxin-antitoxin system VapC family toxin [Sphingobium sp.]|uniref:type II toxin-antitoxin system VapC family toxin n=1 Tax=Sphingobium sp. TaxID=1912891 RepID=UPI002ED49F16